MIPIYLGAYLWKYRMEKFNLTENDSSKGILKKFVLFV